MSELDELKQAGRAYFACLIAAQKLALGDDYEEVLAMLEESSTGSRTIAGLRRQLEEKLNADPS
jgi:hypothetical protein